MIEIYLVYLIDLLNIQSFKKFQFELYLFKKGNWTFC
jgi:hypothetical protein